MARRRTHECRNCGAPLGIPEDHERFFTCKHCGSVLEDVTPPDAPPQAPIQITIATTPVDRASLQTYARPARAAGTMGCVVVLVVVIGIIGAVSAFVNGAIESTEDLVGPLTGQASGTTVYSHVAAATISSDDGTGPDVVAGAYTSDAPSLQYLDFDASPPQRWSVAADLPENTAVFTQVKATPELVIVSAGSTLRAHSRERGTVAWTATLSDEVQPNLCTDCFRIIGDRVVTLSIDGVLAAHSLASGERIWSATLQETPRQIVRFGGHPAVLDTVADVTTLHVFSAADGADIAQLPLSCPDRTFGGRNDVGIYDHLFQGPEGSVLYLADQSFGGCAQRWSPASTTAPAWEVAYSYPDLSGADAHQVQVTPSSVLVVSENVIDVLDLATGAPRRVAEVPDAELLPVGVGEGGVVVVAAKSTRGTATWSLVGIDLGTGGVKWTFGLEASETLLADGFGFAVDDVWTATVGGPGVVVAQYRPDDAVLVTQTIPLDSGTASQPAVVDVAGDGSNTLTVFDWNGTDLHLSMNGTYLVVDVAGGSLRATVG